MGKAVITNAGRLPSKKVIHTVGPKWDERHPQRNEQLRSCYSNSLELVEKNNLKSVAFPNISTGVYRFPKKEAAEIAIEAVKNYQSKIIEEVMFVCFDDVNFDLYKDLLDGPK